MASVHETGNRGGRRDKAKGKKKELVQHTIPFSEIKTTKIQIKF